MQRRLRLKQSDLVNEGYASINKKTFTSLELTEDMGLEVVVSKKRYKFKLKVDETLEDGVFLSREDMLKNGLQDNTISTVRGFKP